MQFNPEMLAAAQQYGLISSSESLKYNQSQNIQSMNPKQHLKQYQLIQSISEAPEREESSALHLDEDYFHSSRFQSQILKASNTSPESDRQYKIPVLQNHAEDRQISKTIDQIQELIRATQDKIGSSERTSQRISVQTFNSEGGGNQTAEDRNSLKKDWQEKLQQSLYSSNKKLMSNQMEIQVENEKGIIHQQEQFKEKRQNREVLLAQEGPLMFEEEQKINTKIIQDNNNAQIEEMNSDQPYQELEIASKREYIPLSMQIMNQIQSPKQESQQKQLKEQSLIQKDRQNQQRLIEKQKQLVLKRYEELTKKQQHQIQHKQIDMGSTGNQKQGIQSSNESKKEQLLREQNIKHEGELRLGTSPGRQQVNKFADHNDISRNEIGPSTPKRIYLSLDQFKLKQPVNPAVRSAKKHHTPVNTALTKETYQPSKITPKSPGNDVPSVLKKGSQYQNESSLELIRKMMKQKDFKEFEVPQEESDHNYLAQIGQKIERDTSGRNTLEGAELEATVENRNQMDQMSQKIDQDMNQNTTSHPNEQQVQVNQEKIITNGNIPSQYMLFQNKAASTSNLNILKENTSLSRKHHTQMSQDSLLRSLNARKNYTFASNGEKCLILAKEQTSNVGISPRQNQTGGNHQSCQDQIIPYAQYYEDPMRQSEILLMEEQEAFEEIYQQKALDQYKILDPRQDSQNKRTDSQQLRLQQQLNSSEMPSAGQQFYQSYVDSNNLSQNNANTSNLTNLKTKESNNQKQTNSEQRGTLSSTSQQQDLIKQKDLRWLDYSALERNSLWLQVRNQNRTNLQQQLQSKELAQCTFKPTVNTLHNKRNNILSSALMQLNDISAPQLNHTITSTLNVTNNRLGNVSPSSLSFQQTGSPQNKILQNSNILNESNCFSQKAANNQRKQAQNNNNITQSKDVSGHLVKNTNRSFSSNSNTNRSALTLPRQQIVMVSSIDRSILSKSISPTQRSMLGGSSSFQSISSKNKRVQSTKSYSELSRIKKSQNNLPYKIEDSNKIRSPGGFSSPGLFFPPSKVVSSQIGLTNNVNILKMPGKVQIQKFQ